MSMYVWLKKEIESQGGFERRTPACLYDNFLGQEVCFEKGLYRTYKFGLEDDLPEELESFVFEITLNEYFETSPYRERGVYRVSDLPEVEAELDYYNHGNHKDKQKYELKIRGAKTIAAARQLYRRIRVGVVQPVLSYEKPQISQPKPEELDISPLSQIYVVSSR